MIRISPKASRAILSAFLCASVVTAPVVLTGCTDDKAKAEQESHDQAIRDFEEAKEKQEQAKELSEQVDQWKEKYEATKDNG